jgi:ELWxxDGT repeat protein
VSDGTAGGTSLLKDVEPGADSGNPTDLVVFDNKLYFEAGAADRVMWVTDGTAAGTVKASGLGAEPTSFPLAADASAMFISGAKKQSYTGALIKYCTA